jgi:hypothetical protein
MKDPLMLDKIASLLILFPQKDKIYVVLFYIVSVLMLIIQLVFRFDRVDLVVQGIATTSIRGKYTIFFIYFACKDKYGIISDLIK